MPIFDCNRKLVCYVQPNLSVSGLTMDNALALILDKLETTLGDSKTGEVIFNFKSRWTRKRTQPFAHSSWQTMDIRNEPPWIVSEQCCNISISWIPDFECEIKSKNVHEVL